MDSDDILKSENLSFGCLDSNFLSAACWMNGTNVCGSDQYSGFSIRTGAIVANILSQESLMLSHSVAIFLKKLDPGALVFLVNRKSTL